MKSIPVKAPPLNVSPPPAPVMVCRFAVAVSRSAPTVPWISVGWVGAISRDCNVITAMLPFAAESR